MLSERQNETLTRVGPGTPMGALLRRYWHPIAPSSSVAVRGTRDVRILGEDLVLYRTESGSLGLIQEKCPHRGASFCYGIVEADGIRCPYHGWRFDFEGACVELPPEPKETKLLGRVRATAYPVEELGGLVFAYLGPSPAPELPRWDALVWDNALRDIGQATLPCNWLQIMENSVDPYHTEWLHGHHLSHVKEKQGGETKLRYKKPHAKVGFDVFEYGIIKRRMLEGGSEEDDDWKIGHPLLFPCALRVGEHGRHRIQYRVPIDDTHTWHVWYSCYRFDGVTMPPQLVIPTYDVAWRDGNGFIVDFVDGGDIMAWVTQGPIADRSTEILGSSDKGIALYRRLLFEQLDRIEAGEDPLGVIRDGSANGIIELPQEKNKLRGGASFLLQAMENGHGRYSPLKDDIRRIVEAEIDGP